MRTKPVPGSEPAQKKGLSSIQRNRYSPPDVPSLLSSLHAVQSRQKKLIHSTIHTYSSGGFENQPEDRDQPVASSSKQMAGNEKDRDEKYYLTSWKMSEHHYRRKDCPFPVLARGLFTANKAYSLPHADVPKEEEKDESRIVARGYDKFFNVGEVEWTKWEALEKHTSPPYSLTYKSNGCLILLSALNERELFVSSKHSAGTSTATAIPSATEDVDAASHVEAGGHGETDSRNEAAAVSSLSADLSSLKVNGGSISAESVYPEKQADKLDSFPRTADDPTSPPADHIEADTQIDGSGPAYFADRQGEAVSPEPVVRIKPNPSANQTGRDPNSKSAQKREKKKLEAAEKKAKAAKAAEEARTNREAFDKQVQEDADEDRESRSGGQTHAGMGRKWLKVHLDRAGRTEAELASELWKRGLTCVFEVSHETPL
jgi:tRNA ligase